ncbi:MAG: hypothetical protein PHP62_03295 [Candidatus Moranbacteria bacterium]|nr:hypothetical protein [Candidatus Moranbacteria bacterium]
MLKFLGVSSILCSMGIIWFGKAVWMAPIAILIGFGYLYLDYLNYKEKEKQK